MKLKKISKSELYLFMIIIFLFIFILGAGMNMYIMKENSGKMPVFLQKGEYIDSDLHIGYGNKSEIKASFFADNLEMGKNMWSIGDIFLMTGIIGNALFTLLYITSKFERNTYYE